MMRNHNPKKRNKAPKVTTLHMELNQTKPITMSQRHAFEAWEDGQDLLLSGYAGTGKTYVACYLAMSMGLKVYIVRSAVPTRDMGFMPGNAKEKASMYEGPYIDACSKLFGRSDAYSILSQKGYIEFVTTSYLRGLTLDNCVVIVDEMQNMNFHELDTIITRAGNNCRMVFLGDVTQTDLVRDAEKAGLKKFMSILERIDGFDIIEFGVHDIVRSDRVKQYIIAKDQLE
jgi:phosphate starvation-inducible protein PhoH and related proteins